VRKPNSIALKKGGYPKSTLKNSIPETASNYFEKKSKGAVKLKSNNLQSKKGLCFI